MADSQPRISRIEIYDPEATASRILDAEDVGMFMSATWNKYFAKYVPMREGMLRDNVNLEPFKVIYTSIYAHYQWNGWLYVSPTTGSSWAKQGETKVKTNTKLEYSKEQNLNATSHWEIPAYDAFNKSVAKQVTEFIRRKK